ncbi:biotin-independent malonate decarboxylase subunit beta [Streptomyces sp. AM2-3-1]|uniref:biotin-independent malonate decarboxylase subunit beta n=1 Tax=Streptomyces sp. AM2-3-1 TaxID=3075824 RepID=UPI0028C39503|nr:biotin-independent malonate decarboxylase subunit beta [Streptomyces sp. AM2-3-1]WNO62451.1 biotin-independent malonate decarboxylase subunit beta [Streptomyces sp. AM2-3-1]
MTTTTNTTAETARALGATSDGRSIDWQHVLHRKSFLELDALARALVLLDDGSARVLCGPFERLESPWLEPQDVTPQSDDGVVIARGTIDGTAVLVVSIEQDFQGGGIGEVSGAKITQALRLAAADSRTGTAIPAVLLLETGGVRLQEGNLGLNAVAEICSAVLELRPLAPVVGVVAGSVGSFGGVSIATGLCTHVVITPEARIGLNGAAVIEQEAGAEEFDSSDRRLIWAVDGGEQRRVTGLADTLVVDDADELRGAVRRAISAGTASPGSHRSERLDVLEARLATLDPADPPEPSQLREMWGDTYDIPSTGKTPQRRGSDIEPHSDAAHSSMQSSERGRRWMTALADGTTPLPVIGSVLRADTDGIVYLAVVPDPDNPFYRARQGQVGLTECAALARTMREITAQDEGATKRRAIVAVVDLPSQAYGRIEEMAGLHQAIAAAVDATEAARVAGHPLVTLVVGQALSGGFLTHGLQASQILALDDPGVQIHAMHKQAAAHITMRTVDQLDELAQTITPLSYDVRDWATLGFCDGLLEVDNAESPTDRDITNVAQAISDAVERARSGPTDLSNRLHSQGAKKNRKASRAVRDTLARQWNEN